MASVVSSRSTPVAEAVRCITATGIDTTRAVEMVGGLVAAARHALDVRKTITFYKPGLSGLLSRDQNVRNAVQGAVESLVGPGTALSFTLDSSMLRISAQPAA